MGNRRTFDTTKHTTADMRRNVLSECSDEYLKAQNSGESGVEKGAEEEAQLEVEVEVAEVVRSSAWMGEEVLCVLLYMLRGSLDDRIVSTYAFVRST